MHAVQGACGLLGSCGWKSSEDFCLWDSGDHKDQRCEASAPSGPPVAPHIPRLVLEDAFPPVSVSPFWLEKRFNGKSCVLHSGCLLALPWGSPLEEVISNSVKSQYHCSWKSNIWAVLATSALLATTLLKHSCCWQNSCIFQDLPGQG